MMDEQIKDFCEMCGRRNKTLRLAVDPNGVKKTLCKLCADGSKEMLEKNK